MKVPQLKRVNWGLLAYHLLAILLLVIGTQQLQLVRWVPLMQAYQQQGIEGVAQRSDNMGATLAALWMGPLYALVVAVIVGCLLSSIVVVHQRASRLIPPILFVLSIVASWTRYYKSRFVTEVLALLRWPLEALPLEVRLAIVGSGLIIIGFLVFWLTKKKSLVTDE